MLSRDRTIDDQEAMRMAEQLLWRASMTGKPVNIGHLASYAADNQEVSFLVKLAGKLGVQVNR